MESRRAFEILSRARDQNDIVCVYTSPYSTQFSAGWVEALSENAVILRALHPNGRADGWSLKIIDEVARLDVGGQYEERLEFLAQMREARWKEGILPNLLPDADLIWELFVACQKHDFVVEVATGSEEPVQGFVQDVTPHWVTIDKISFEGHFDGQATISTEDIQEITVDDQNLQDLQMLTRRHGRGNGTWR